MPTYSVSVRGLSRLEAIPGGLDRAQRRFLELAGDRLQTSVSKAAPHKSGRLAASVKSTTLSSTTLRIGTDLVYAHAQDQGAFIAPKGKALRFTGGDGGFSRRAVRLPATKFFQKGLRPRRRIISSAYSQAFDQLPGV